jgi:hypothetical protein
MKAARKQLPGVGRLPLAERHDGEMMPPAASNVRTSSSTSPMPALAQQVIRPTQNVYSHRGHRSASTKDVIIDRT